MTRTRKAVRIVLLTTVVVGSLAACDNGSFAGSGKMADSAGRTGKGSGAYINFNVLCPEGSDVVSGNVAYLDRRAGVRLTGLATTVSPPKNDQNYTCDNSRTQGHYVGSYTAAGVAGVGVFSLDIAVSGCGANRPSIAIAATTGPYAGYRNSQCLKGTVTPLDSLGVPIQPSMPNPAE